MWGCMKGHWSQLKFVFDKYVAIGHYRVKIFCEVYPKNYDFIYFFLNKVVSIFNLITINILLGY